MILAAHDLSWPGSSTLPAPFYVMTSLPHCNRNTGWLHDWFRRLCCAMCGKLACGKLNYDKRMLGHKQKLLRHVPGCAGAWYATGLGPGSHGGPKMYGGPVVHSDVASVAGPPVFRILSALCPHYSRSLSAPFPQHLRNLSALFPRYFRIVTTP